MYTLQGKTHPTCHTYPTQSQHMVPNHTYLTWSMYSNHSCSHQQSWEGPLLSRKRAPDTIHSMMANQSVGPYPISFPSQPMKQWGQSQPSVDGWLLGLPGPYHRHAIGTFNTSSRGPTHRSLTDIGRGYNLEGAGFPHTTPRPSQPTVLFFPLKGPTWSLDYSKSITGSKIQV
jgi:hypothetical protein